MPIAARVGSCSLWSSVYLPPGPLAGEAFCLFDQAQGKTFDLTDTNMREPRRTPGGQTFNCTSVSWVVAPAAAGSDVERLAQAFGEPMVADIQEHGVLCWDFAQTMLEIGPLWIGSLPQLVTIPGSTTFHLRLSFGRGAPTLNMEHVVRVCLSGQYQHGIEF